MTRAAAAVVLAWAVALPSLAGAQTAPAPPRPNPIQVTIAPPVSVAPRREIPALEQKHLQKFRQAQAYRQARMFEEAEAALTSLNAEAPHHPLVVTEMALLYLDRREWSAVEKLGRAERAWAKDSLLLSRELTTAYERMERPRDAAQIVLESWVASPYESGWAVTTLGRLMESDSKGVRDAMRKTTEKVPGRPDLLRGRARLEWVAGDMQAALKVLERADGPQYRPSLRWLFADDVLTMGAPADTNTAIEALLALSADEGQPETDRLQGARRAWTLVQRRAGEPLAAIRMQQALHDIPPTRWDPELLVGVARGLRQAGRTDEARTLLDARGTDPTLKRSIDYERALADLKDGPPERALSGLLAASATSAEAQFRYAEVLLYAGMPDSALVIYQTIAAEPRAAFAGAALERSFLIEDADPRTALAPLGRAAWEEWRGQQDRAMAITDSLYRALPHRSMWAHVAMMLSAQRERAGEARAALAPVLALADSLPDDRLAPVARQRAGDLYIKLKDEPKAAAQYEECLARYPKAWNAAEVRRSLEQLRRERRF
jgi:tetratricopeptide (TPR) repeat protein